MEIFCARTAAPVALFTTATTYPVAPGEGFQLKVGIRALTVTPGGVVLPGDNPVGTAGTGRLAGATLKLPLFELPPPGGGLVATTGKLPAVERSDGLRVIVS